MLLVAYIAQSPAFEVCVATSRFSVATWNGSKSHSPSLCLGGSLCAGQSIAIMFRCAIRRGIDEKRVWLFSAHAIAAWVKQHVQDAEPQCRGFQKSMHVAPSPIDPFDPFGRQICAKRSVPRDFSKQTSPNHCRQLLRRDSRPGVFSEY